MIFGFGKNNGGDAHREIQPADLDTMLRGGKALVIDVREADEFAAGHIPGAVNFPCPRSMRLCCPTRVSAGSC